MMNERMNIVSQFDCVQILTLYFLMPYPKIIYHLEILWLQINNKNQSKLVEAKRIMSWKVQW